MNRLCNARPSHTHVSAIAIGAALCLGLSAASAQVTVPPIYAMPAYSSSAGNDLGFYLNADFGPSFMPNFQSSRFGYEGNFNMRPGVRADVEPGFNFLSTGALTLGGEFETGGIYNRIHSLTQAGSVVSYGGDYYQVPLLGNLVLKLHPDSFVAPYVGIGGGGDWSRARIPSPGFFGPYERNDQLDPAVQAMGGVRFRLAPNIELGVGYKFLADFPSEGRYIATHAAAATLSVWF
ncbi:MAG TPA: outer membrane beta-barrel protein [Verrucomicrobiae bacterium]|jgi:opacity protein-like surface antigen|nr:outer membrane beta-barrel protein [Verrucomicrobiae bacterium]